VCRRTLAVEIFGRRKSLAFIDRGDTEEALK
jgi:hypothetical protein